MLDDDRARVLRREKWGAEVDMPTQARARARRSR
jgi:hypothetical protein